MSTATESSDMVAGIKGRIYHAPDPVAALCLASLPPAGNPVLAEEAAAVRVETVQFPGGGQVRVVRGPAIGGQAKAAPAPAVPRPERAIAAGSGMLWLVGDDRLTACWVQRTSYVNGYRIRCLGY